MENDLIRRSDAENIFRSARRAMKPENYSVREFLIRDNILRNAEVIVHFIPAVDAVEVVRCEDCIFWHKPLQCPMDTSEAWTSFDEYCSRAQRREEEHNAAD